MREKFYAFMQGRYGVDDLNKTLMVLCIIAFVVNIFIPGSVLTIIGYVFWFLAIFRMFSRQVYKRNQENEKFLQLFAPITRMKTLHNKRKQDPNNKYYRCSSCHQIVRLPKGRGKIVVTCPKCKHQFEKRT
ncbi:MAG: hypothetical protein ACK5LC_03460 [Coprobacillaceae bacterium]